MRTIDPGTLREITDRLAAEFEPELIVLFGSYAWGTPNESSDIDLLIVVGESQEDPAERATRALRCLRDIVVPMDILVKTRAEVERYRSVRASLTRQILESGRILYERPKALAGA